MKNLVIIVLILVSSSCFASKYTDEEIEFLTNEISCQSIEKYKQEIKSLPLKKQEILLFIYSQQDFQNKIVKPKIKTILTTISKQEMVTGKFSNKTNQNFEKFQIEIQNELNKILISLK